MERIDQVHPSTLSSFALMVAKAIEAAGHDFRPIFRRAGMDPAELEDANARYPVGAMMRMWREVPSVTGDEAFGLSVVQHWHPTTLHALGYAWLASDTLLHALERAARYMRLVSNVAEAALQKTDDEYRLIMHRSVMDTRTVPVAVDAWNALLVHMCRMSYGESFAPRRVRLGRRAPADAAPYARFFRAPVEFDAPITTIHFDRSSLEKRLPTRNAELARANERVISEYLNRFDRSSVTLQVEAKLVESLPSGSASQESIADALHLSPRSLQRKLRDEGTTYKNLLDETRRDLAARYISEKQISVNEVAYMLGFSEPANFSRAFKRWTGASPSAYRELNSARIAHRVGGGPA